MYRKNHKDGTQDWCFGNAAKKKTTFNHTSSGMTHGLPMRPAGPTHFRQAAAKKRKVVFTNSNK